jgi:hypothetical protein
MSYMLVGALQLVLLFLATPVHAYIPVEREPEPPLARSSPHPVDAGFVRALRADSAEARGNVFRAARYPMPDGAYREVVFRSFVIWTPDALLLTGGTAKDGQARLRPMVQWLAGVANAKGGEDVVSLSVRDGQISGRASFAGQRYRQDLTVEGARATVTYTRIGEDVAARPAHTFYRLFAGEVLLTELALMADFALLHDEFGDDINALVDAMIELVAELNAIYFRDLRVVFKLSALVVQNVAVDLYEFPTLFGDQTITVTGLEQFRDDWNARHGNVQRDVAVLITKHRVISSKTGVANGLSELDTLCDLPKAYVLFTYSTDPAELIYRAAHEIGHSFGAEHTYCTPDPNSPIGFIDGCQVVPGNPMCFQGPDPVYPSVPGTIMSAGCPEQALHFHDIIRLVIDQALAAKTCLTPAWLKLVENGVPETNLDSLFNTPRYFAIDVPPDVLEFRITTAGGSGNVDLYAQRRTLNAFASWDSAHPGNTEQLLFTSPVRPGRWYLRLQPADDGSGRLPSFAGVALVAAYVDAVELQNGVPYAEADLPAGTVRLFRFEVPTGTSSVTLTASSSSGQFEFLVRRGARPDLQNPSSSDNLAYDATSATTKSYEPAVGQPRIGTWYVAIRTLADLPDLTVTAAYAL